ncbi:alpha/beta hydrolase [Antiquaquibacter oligotrophicus]|nr:alpha/beta hydrolase [Antiquaquibacter oligotrophicus]UDF14034.1 alpha/beta hydrolase [Antiquaquibacter oligotrophicus]
MLERYQSGSAGPRILLVHGLSSSADSWWRVVEALAPHARVTTIDLRGHGASAPADSYALRDYASDLPRENWDAVVAHSLGGAAAVLAASQPGFARSLVLLDPVLEVPEADFEAVLADQVSELRLDEASVAAEKPHWDERDRAAKLVGVRSVDPAAVEGSFRDTGRWDVRAEARALRSPTLLIAGDPAIYTMLDPELGRTLAAENESIDYRVIAGAGHSPHRDKPEETLAVLTERLLG